MMWVKGEKEKAAETERNPNNKRVNNITYNEQYIPVLTAANKARKPMAYIIDFFRSNRPGRNIHAVAG